MKVSVLYLGHLKCKKHVVDEAGMRVVRTVKSPMSAILIEHPKLGNILYDTGNSPFYRTEYSKENREAYPISEFISVADALEEKGLTVEDIDILILSHLHFDHAGGLRYFKGTKAIQNVVVSEAELKNAFAQVMTEQPGAYERGTFELDDVRFRTISEDLQLADDINIFTERAHTPGVLGMLLFTKSKGAVIATSDAIYTRDVYEQGVTPETEQDFAKNLVRVKKMQEKYDAELLFGHDYEQITEWCEAGTFE